MGLSQLEGDCSIFGLVTLADEVGKCKAVLGDVRAEAVGADAGVCESFGDAVVFAGLGAVG